MIAHPPPKMLNVLNAVAIILGKKVLDTRDYHHPLTLIPMIDDLASKRHIFDPDSLSADTISQLQPFLSDPDFKPDKMAQISIACKHLCAWVHSIHALY